MPDELPSPDLPPIAEVELPRAVDALEGAAPPFSAVRAPPLDELPRPLAFDATFPPADALLEDDDLEVLEPVAPLRVEALPPEALPSDPPRD